MAAFMSEMLAMVHESANSATMDAVSKGIDVPFQGILLHLDATFQGLDTTMGNATGGQVNMRQVTIVVSLGLANANSGNNDASTQIAQGNTVNELQSGDFVNVIGAGDAAAANRDNLVVMCQRINADDIDCLEPPADPEPTTTTTVVTPTTTANPGITTTTVNAVTPTTVVNATTTTTIVAPTTCPAPPTTLAPVGPTVAVSLPPGFTPGMVLPLTC